MKRFIAVVCVFLIAASMSNAAVYADITFGVCGLSATWDFYEDTGKLVISGKGELYGYESCAKTQWYYLRDKVTAVEISDGITSIGANSFGNFTKLKTVRYPATVTSVGSGAFAYCDSLESFDLSKVTYIGDHAFCFCSSLKSITLCSKLETVEAGTFFACTGIKSVKIPDSVKTVGDCAFYFCTSLDTLSIPASVTYLGISAFASCESLKTASYAGSEIDFAKLGYREEFNEITVSVAKSSTEKELYSYTVKNSKATITAYNGCFDRPIPSKLGGYSVVAVADGAYNGKGYLRTIALPEGITSVGKNSFDGCAGAKSITFPKTLTEIGDFAFSDCISLETVTVPKTVEKLGIYAFGGCDALQSASVEYITELPEGTFANCKSLKTVNLSPNLVSIGERAFASSGTETLSLPISLVSVGDGAFDMCRLDTVNYAGNVGQWKMITVGDGNDPLEKAEILYAGMIKGDFDDDGRVGASDALYLLFYTMYPDDYPITQSADLDKNGSEDSDDAVYLLMCLFFPKEFSL